MKTPLNNPTGRILVVILLLITVLQAGAADQEAAAATVPVGSSDVLSVLGGLLSVIAAIFLVGYLYSRMKGPRIGGDSVINIVASQGLGPKERIVLVEIADTQLLVGMTATQVQTLHVFDEPVVRATESTNDISFSARLKHALGGGRK